ncbi:hypothetical protein VTH82DRAFT_7298 [Thermothelomyces myriococcoides]
MMHHRNRNAAAPEDYFVLLSPHLALVYTAALLVCGKGSREEAALGQQRGTNYRRLTKSAHYTRDTTYFSATLFNPPF